MGTYGRIGLPMVLLTHAGGYDQELRGMGYQDVDLLARLAMIGSVRTVNNEWVGWSIPNQKEKVATILLKGGKKRRCEHKAEEDQAKMLNLSPDLREKFGSFDELNKHNTRISKKKTRAGQFRRNKDLKLLGVSFGRPAWVVKMQGASSQIAKIYQEGRGPSSSGE